MSSLFKRLSVLLVMILFTSCQTVRVYSDYDHSANFNAYKTFSIYDEGIDKQNLNDIEKRRIKEALRQNFKMKGYREDTSNPDLLVNAVFSTKEKIQINSAYPYWGGYYSPYWYGGWYGGWGWGLGWNSTYADQYLEGTLLVDVIDSNKNILVWQGKGIARRYEDYQKNEERMNEAITRIVEEFPTPMGSDQKMAMK